MAGQLPQSGGKTCVYYYSSKLLPWKEGANYPKAFRTRPRNQSTLVTRAMVGVVRLDQNRKAGRLVPKEPVSSQVSGVVFRQSDRTGACGAYGG